jgi:hypothetical protein
LLHQSFSQRWLWRPGYPPLGYGFSLSRVRDSWDSRPYISVSNLRLPFSSPPMTRRATVEVFEPASTRATGTFNPPYIGFLSWASLLSQFDSYICTRTEYGITCRRVNFARCYATKAGIRVCLKQFVCNGGNPTIRLSFPGQQFPRLRCLRIASRWLVMDIL